MPKKPNKVTADDIHLLLEKSNKILSGATKKLKEEKKKKTVCRDCNELKLIYRAWRCEPCYKEFTNLKQAAAVGRRWISTNGYEYIYDENMKPVLYHRYRMAQIIGRPLTGDETVTHRDGNKTNNTDENLMLIPKKGVDLGSLCCRNCGTPYF